MLSKFNIRFALILLSLFSFALFSFHPRPRVYHFSFSSFFTFCNGAGSFGGTLGTFVTSSKVLQAKPSKATRDFFFFTITISPMSGSIVGSTKISKPPLAEEESMPTRRTTSERSFARSLSLSRPMVRIPSLLFFGTKRFRGLTSGLGANGTGTEAPDPARDWLKDVLASVFAERVTEIRRMPA